MFSKSEFILNAIDKFEKRTQNLPRPESYISGEEISLLGQKRNLVVLEDSRNYVEADGIYIGLFVKDTDSFELKQKTVEKWLRECCAKFITQRCVEIHQIFEDYGIPFPQI